MTHKVFAWLMLMDRVNTRNMLVRRHFLIGEDHSCMTCITRVLETNGNLLYDCTFARRCWENGITHYFIEIAILAGWNIWKKRNKVLSDGDNASHHDWLIILKKDLEILRYRLPPDKSSFIEGLLVTPPI